MGSRRRWLAVFGAVAVVALLVAGTFWSGRPDGGAALSTNPWFQGRDSDAADRLGVARRTEGDVTALGRVDAPVVMIEYADYRCPSCSLFAHDTLPTLIDEYVDAGLLRYEWRDLPVLGPDSFDAAVAARAAARQGRYWEYHVALFSKGVEQGRSELDRDFLLGLAVVAGVGDLEQFEANLDDPELAAAVWADIEEAESVGAAVTPTFVIGRTPMVGAQATAVFRQAIEDELRQAGVRR